MTNYWRRLFCVFLACTQLQCANLFEPLSPKDTNAALLYEARTLIDQGQYTDALTYLAEMDPIFAAQNEVRVTYASAYAGACGMEFIPFFNSISSASITPPNTIFKYLRSSFTDKAATPNYCTLAEAKLKEIGSTEALRLAAMNGSKEVNMLMAILAMAKIGAILRTKSDVDGVNSLGDGSTDAGYTSCNSSNISDAEVLEVASGFGLLIENLPSLLGASNSTSTVLSAVSAIVGLFCGLAPTSKCVILDTGSVDPADKTELIDTYRDLLETQDAGIGTCAPVLPVTPDSCC
jgi:hypothetical protein